VARRRRALSTEEAARRGSGLAGAGGSAPADRDGERRGKGERLLSAVRAGRADPSTCGCSAAALTGHNMKLLIALIAKEAVGWLRSASGILDDEVRERLRIRAAQHGRSTEAEIRAILADAVGVATESTGLAHALLGRFGERGGVDLDLLPRTEGPRAATLPE